MAKPAVNAADHLSEPASCPVCRGGGIFPFLHVADRDYWGCGNCEARFLDPRQHPSCDVEYNHYLHHENHPDDPGYRRFLSKLAGPLLARLPAGSQGDPDTRAFRRFLHTGSVDDPQLFASARRHDAPNPDRLADMLAGRLARLTYAGYLKLDDPDRAATTRRGSRKPSSPRQSGPMSASS